MAVELTGIPTYVTNVDHMDGNQIVTIPNDCTAVIVFSWMWRNNHAGDFDELNWDNGATLDFTQIVTNKSISDPFDVWAYIMTSNSGDWPGTGNKTLYWSFTGIGPIPEGGTVVIAFVKGLYTLDPIRSTDSDKGTAIWTASLAGVEAGDLSFLCGVIWELSNIDVIGVGQAVLDSDVSDNFLDWNISSELAEGSPSYSTSAGLGDTQYNGAIAFALRSLEEVIDNKMLMDLKGRAPRIDFSSRVPSMTLSSRGPRIDFQGRDGEYDD